MLCPQSQATLVVTTVPGAVTADQPDVNFSGYPRPAQLHGPQWVGREKRSVQVLLGPDRSSAPGRLCQTEHQR